MVTLIDTTAAILYIEPENSDSSSSTISSPNDRPKTSPLVPSNSNALFCLFKLNKDLNGVNLSSNQSFQSRFHTPLILVTSTHLKSTKTFEGEITRLQQVFFLQSVLISLYEMAKALGSLSNYHDFLRLDQLKDNKDVNAAITLKKQDFDIELLLMGDLNATPGPTEDLHYPALVYSALQGCVSQLPLDHDFSVEQREAVKRVFQKYQSNPKILQFLRSMDLRSSYRLYPVLSQVHDYHESSHDVYVSLLKKASGLESFPPTQTAPECPYTSFKTRKRGTLCHTIDVIICSNQIEVVGLRSAFDPNQLPTTGAPCSAWPSDHFIISSTLRFGNKNKPKAIPTSTNEKRETN